MEATGSTDGGAGGPSLSYRRSHEEIGIGSNCYTISSSSRSGTIVSSTAYTSGDSHSSRLSSGICISMEASALLELELEMKLGSPEPDEKDAEFGQAIKKHRKENVQTALKETRMKHIESLAQEFLGGSGGSMSALERWFSELGVSWVLQLEVGASAWAFRRTWEWIHALTKIMETIHLTESFFADHGHGFVGMPSISEEEIDSGKQAAISLDSLQIALLIQKAMAKMLIFVDALFSKSICIQERIEAEDTSLVPVNSCLQVNRALSEVLLGIRLQFHSSSSPTEVEKIEKEMVSLLLAKQRKAFDAIRSFMEERRTCILKSMDELLGVGTPQLDNEYQYMLFYNE